MTQRRKSSEANKSGTHAVMLGRRSTHSACLSQAPALLVLRMPAKYSAHDVEVLLDALWAMFTESQARKLKVLVPWDESNEPQQIPLADLASLLESWIA